MDRFKLKENTSGSFSINRDQFPIGDQHPEGHRYAMQIACTSADTSLSSNEHAVIMHMIEGYNIIGTGFGTKAAKNMTLSFWVKTNVPGTYSVALKNGSQNRCQVKEYLAGMSGTVWEKISVTFSGCNDGSWVVSAASGMKITWGLAGAQSTYATTDIDAWKSSNLFLSADQVNFFSSTNNRFFLTGDQLEIGDQSTEFEHRSYGEELALCQRYYQRLDGTQLSGGAGNDRGIFHAHMWGSNNPYWIHHFSPSMRTGPSLELSSGFSGTWYSGGSTATHSNMSIQHANEDRAELAGTHNGSLGQGNSAWFRLATANDFVAFNAEL